MLKTWQTILIVAVIATILVIAGDYTYVYLTAPITLRISTTTSLYDTGLLDYIKKQYEATHNVILQISEQGTGLALAAASAGDADIVLVHSPSQELPYLVNGTLVARKIIAWNYFAIVGPSSDPAHIAGENATQALRSIYAYGQSHLGTLVWIDRNDSSGTATKDASLWTAAGYSLKTIAKNYMYRSTGLNTYTGWYTYTGQGMGATLVIADQKNTTYTLSDMGTYLQYSQSGAISSTYTALVTGGYSLINVYSVYAVNPQKISNVKFDQAITFIQWLISPTGQYAIGDYDVANYSKPLFWGAVLPLKSNSPQPDVSWIKSYAFFNGTECPVQYQAGQTQLYQDP
jgi:tungstate transport system substrate-binding protein